VKRFYKEVTVAESEGGWGIRLDGKTLRTPGKLVFSVPSRALAEAVAAEWAAQGTEVLPDTMRLAKLASTALDRVAVQREAVAEQTAGYAGTDQLCYRATEPAALVEIETALWQPLLDWAARRYGAALVPAIGILPVEQPATAVAVLREEVLALDVLRLTAVADLTACCGSLILALAVLEGRIDAAGAMEAAFADERYQIAKWGADEEAVERLRRVDSDIAAAARFLALLDDRA